MRRAIGRKVTIGFEIKEGVAPGMTKSLHSALADLSLSRAFMVSPGQRRYRIHEKVEVVSLEDAVEEAARG